MGWRGNVPARAVAVPALSAALLFAVQAALAAVPNGELVTLLVLLYAKYLRRAALPAIYAFALLEGLVYGFGLWWLAYLYVWTLLWAAALPLSRGTRPAWQWAALAGVFGLLYGPLCSLPVLLAGGTEAAVSWWAAGIPFDLAHGALNFLLVLLLYPPLDRFFAKLRARGLLL